MSEEIRQLARQHVLLKILGSAAVIEQSSAASKQLKYHHSYITAVLKSRGYTISAIYLHMYLSG